MSIWVYIDHWAYDAAVGVWEQLGRDRRNASDVPSTSRLSCRTARRSVPPVQFPAYNAARAQSPAQFTAANTHTQSARRIYKTLAHLYTHLWKSVENSPTCCLGGRVFMYACWLYLLVWCIQANYNFRTLRLYVQRFARPRLLVFRAFLEVVVGGATFPKIIYNERARLPRNGTTHAHRHKPTHIQIQEDVYC